MRTLGEVAWLIRSDIRHRLQQLHSEALEMRADMVHEELSLIGTIIEVDHMISALNHIRGQLAEGIPKDEIESKRALYD